MTRKLPPHKLKAKSPTKGMSDRMRDILLGMRGRPITVEQMAERLGGHDPTSTRTMLHRMFTDGELEHASPQRNTEAALRNVFGKPVATYWMPYPPKPKGEG